MFDYSCGFDREGEMIIYVNGEQVEMDVVIYDPFPELSEKTANLAIEKEDGKE